MGARITYSAPIDVAIEETVESIKRQVERRSYLVANELRNSALIVLRGQRNGRRYKVPGTYRLQMDKVAGKKRHGRYYTASAPGEPPAVRTGTFRNSWQPTARALFGSYISRIESDVPYAEWLEEGTPGGQMAPRPHHKRILEHAEPKVIRIYSASYD
jgi:hypothetical protein